MHDEIIHFIKMNKLETRVTVLHEEVLLDSGGAIHNLASRPEVNYAGNLLLVNGDQFLFFKTSSSDTSIYYYEEGEKKAQKVYDNFDEWFFETAKDEIEAMKSV